MHLFRGHEYENSLTVLFLFIGGMCTFISKINLFLI